MCVLQRLRRRRRLSRPRSRKATLRRALLFRRPAWGMRLSGGKLCCCTFVVSAPRFDITVIILLRCGCMEPQIDCVRRTISSRMRSERLTARRIEQNGPNFRGGLPLYCRVLFSVCRAMCARVGAMCVCMCLHGVGLTDVEGSGRNALARQCSNPSKFDPVLATQYNEDKTKLFNMWLESDMDIGKAAA